MYFAMMGSAVMSKHRSIPAAQRAIRKRYKMFEKVYPISIYSVAVLESPGYWEKGDTPYKHYFLEWYDNCGKSIKQKGGNRDGKDLYSYKRRK
jgi:hypothetical protein